MYILFLLALFQLWTAWWCRYLHFASLKSRLGSFWVDFSPCIHRTASFKVSFSNNYERLTQENATILVLSASTQNVLFIKKNVKAFSSLTHKTSVLFSLKNQVVWNIPQTKWPRTRNTFWCFSGCHHGLLLFKIHLLYF